MLLIKSCRKREWQEWNNLAYYLHFFWAKWPPWVRPIFSLIFFSLLSTPISHLFQAIDGTTPKWWIDIITMLSCKFLSVKGHMLPSHGPKWRGQAKGGGGVDFRFVCWFEGATWYTAHSCSENKVELSRGCSDFKSNVESSTCCVRDRLRKVRLLSFIHLLCCYTVFRLSHLMLHGSNPTCALHLDLHGILLYARIVMISLRIPLTKDLLIF